MDLELEDFLRHCRLERRLAPLTCSAYELDARACMRFSGRSGVGSVAEVTTPVLRDFLAEEAERRPAASSQARTVGALKCFFRFCVENEYLAGDRRQVGVAEELRDEARVTKSAGAARSRRCAAACGRSRASRSPPAPRSVGRST